MGSKSVGGASSAVAASAHAACARFRGTDPLVVGRTRRKLASDVGFADDSGRIPEARWMRAMTFERLVRDTKFVSEIATTAVGRLKLDRPTAVVTANARVRLDETEKLLGDAHSRAIAEGAATLIHGLAVPFPGFEDDQATEVKPDFAVVAPAIGGDGSWLIIGDAKDYERVRSRIQDTKLLKGFLQVALGAEAVESWTRRPREMSVHTHGVLAVPRNAFLQPEALVERLDDHRTEVRMRVAERRREAEQKPYDNAEDLTQYVSHLRATFDPATCTTCTLFSYCRNELRTSADPADLLIELGISADIRPHVLGVVDGTGTGEAAPASVVANVIATRDGVAQPTGQRRVDPAGLPGTVNVVIAKSDTAALGIHGIALQRVTANGREPWQLTTFHDPQSSPETRRDVMRLLGGELRNAMTEQRRLNRNAPNSVHLVVPDSATADILASIADNLAGIELSRLRWEQDRAMGRPPLTFNPTPTEPGKYPTCGRELAKLIIGAWPGPLTDIATNGDDNPLWESMNRLLALLPAGHWTTYGDVATVLGTAAQPLENRLATVAAPNAHRVLTSQGEVSPSFRWVEPGRTDSPKEILEQEGLEFAAGGRADTAKRLSVSQLEELRKAAEDDFDASR
ncbi:hypothetical protein ACFYU5_17545 [Nocardia aobensis]|uniref:Uncharacterized protein n=1 Tax=Nocardia aobensis TaxID=257277 RepID=A0ABW6P489_9NOCA